MPQKTLDVAKIPFKPGRVYKHDNFMDVCFVVRSVYEGSTHYKLKISWINMAFVDSFHIFGLQTHNIKINKNDVNRYKWALRSDNTQCYRYSEWIEML